MPHSFSSLQMTILLVSAILVTHAVQPAVADEREPPRRTLDVEVLIQSLPSYRIKSQEWGRVFQELGYSVRFRAPRAGEASRVEDLDRDDFLATRVVAAMAPDGSIRIGKQKFDIESTKLLTQALDEIQLHGAKGPRDSNPTWGLTDEQFLEVTQLLGVPVENPVELQSSILAVESVGLPANMRMKFTEAARQQALAKRPASAPDTIELQGFTKGSAIAIILAQYGLGFRPRYVAPGKYDMEIDRGNESSNLWPIGWKPAQSFSEILPTYLRAIPLDVEDVEVSVLVGAVSEKIGLAHFSSAYALKAKGLDLHTLKYTRRDDRISPVRLLTAVGDKLELGFDVRVDEGGKMFLWVTTADDSQAYRNRFANVQPK